MEEHENGADELLWRYIEKLKQADEPAASDPITWTETDAPDCVPLLWVADAVHWALQPMNSPADASLPGELVAAIRHDESRSHLFGTARATVWGRAPFLRAALVVGVAALLAVAVWSRRPGPHSVTVALNVRSMIQDHQEFVEDPGRVTVRSADARQVAARLTPQLGFTVAPVDLSLAGANLLGGRRCSLDGQPIAFFMYQAQGKPVSVYELRAPRCRLPGMAAETREGRRFLRGTDGRCNVEAWRAGDRVYAIVSVLPADRLLEMAMHVSGGSNQEGAGDVL